MLGEYARWISYICYSSQKPLNHCLYTKESCNGQINTNIVQKSQGNLHWMQVHIVNSFFRASFFYIIIILVFINHHHFPLVLICYHHRLCEIPLYMSSSLLLSLLCLTPKKLPPPVTLIQSRHNLFNPILLHISYLHFNLACFLLTI